jgi:hypothetical protein
MGQSDQVRRHQAGVMRAIRTEYSVTPDLRTASMSEMGHSRHVGCRG